MPEQLNTSAAVGPPSTRTLHLTPDSWICIDCGFDTAPGMATQADINLMLSPVSVTNTFEMVVDDDSEVYTVKPSVWRKAGMDGKRGCLCIGCLEVRIKRRLVPNDFPRDHGLNLLPRGTARLMSRRRWPFKMAELA